LLVRTRYRQSDDRVWTTALADYQTFSPAYNVKELTPPSSS
jgi:hypothetical protein